MRFGRDLHDGGGTSLFERSRELGGGPESRRDRAQERARGAAHAARAHRPDVAVLDLEMPGADGVKVATALRGELPACRVVIVTSHGRPGHLKRALSAGVRGFVPKTVSAQQLAEIIRTVRAGNRYVDPELAADAIAAGDSPLTAREAEVLEFAADGAPVAEIAERAALSQGTVRNYLSSAVSKLGAENRHSAVRLARERGWV
ncbi:response regulator [Streptomyces sp. NBC_00009]|uniref:response regulator n=1 Tax=Streptomyces sp. NBC_00009 TaxID=2975620 RepID=UPI003863CA08